MKKLLYMGDFLNEQEEKEEQWKLTIDISKIWEQYSSNKIDIENFNNQYFNFINNNENKITEKTNKESWSELNEIIQELKNNSDKDKSHATWDKIYDWGDNNLVEIKAQNKDF